MTNYSHLSYEDRKNIGDRLNENKSINQTAQELYEYGSLESNDFQPLQDNKTSNFNNKSAIEKDDIER